ncbi:histidinol-phosphatase HisJ [Bacillus sp. NPDC077027]|uniref:histidinol-phosphatase HisJ n=1 Tax=Bacillus sp. NPDC077027 TaxID=3390548 RepID=UPI003D004D72
MLKQDAHIHTPFCPHGSADSFHIYIEQAIKKGFDSITFTEHAPLPPSFVDPTPDQDSAMKHSDIEAYINTLGQLKKEYKGQLIVKTGLEVDYIKAYEEETRAFLDCYGPALDDSILSVHFLPAFDSYICLDFDEHAFKQLIEIYGSIEQVYSLYFQEIHSSILSSLGTFKPKRIGHITLVQKFIQLFPYQMSSTLRDQVVLCLNETEKKGMSLDFNTSGLRKTYARSIYLDDWMIEIAKQKKIPLVFGSDAHQAEDVGYAYDQFEKIMNCN